MGNFQTVLTPLVRLRCGDAALYAKLEWCNAAGSVKDRAARYMLRRAEAQGLAPGGSVVDATSGNTGIALASLCAAGGYGCTVVMPENMSLERRKLLHHYGAQLVLTPQEAGMAGAVAEAKRIADQTPGCFFLDQFQNPANLQAHYETTGPELWQQTGGKATVFIASVGTGGTLMGAGKYLKEHCSGLRIAAVRSAPGSDIPGIGANLSSAFLGETQIDEWITVTTRQAWESALYLAREEGLAAGISSGAAYFAARQLLFRPEYAGETAVVLFPDSAERYLYSGGCPDL